MNTPDFASPDLADRIRTEIARLLHVTEDRVTPDAKLADDLDIDSLLHISMVMGLERSFDVMLSDREAAGMVRVADVIEAVRRHVERRAPRPGGQTNPRGDGGCPSG